MQVHPEISSKSHSLLVSSESMSTSAQPAFAAPYARVVILPSVSILLQVMLPQRLPGSLTVKEKGWSPAFPACTLIPTALNPQPPRPPTLQHPHTPLTPTSHPGRRPTNPVIVFPSPCPSSLFSSLPSDAHKTFGHVHRLILKIVLLHWLCARPHGCRRSCPRDRIKQFTTGKDRKESLFWCNLPIKSNMRWFRDNIVITVAEAFKMKVPV